MKKILIIIGKLKVGGAEKVARDIGYYADKKEFNIHYIVFEDEVGSYEKELKESGCTIHHFDSPNKNHLNYYRCLKKLFQKEQFHVVHCHTMFSSAWAVMAAKKCGVPIRISHSHTIRGERKRGFIRNTYEGFMRKVIQRDSTHYIGCGKSAGEWLFGQEFFKKKGTIIYNGIDLLNFKYKSAKAIEIRKQYSVGNCFVLGHVGHLADVKNQAFIIRLLPDILKEKQDTVLFLIGDGDNRDKLKGLVHSLKLDDHVIFTGNVNNVYDYLNAIDVFVFPSFHEGMPLALIEVQTNGLPCVISDAIPEDVVQTDLVQYCSLEDPQKWIDLIFSSERSDSESYYKKMYDLGFDTSVMLNKIYRIYEGK